MFRQRALIKFFLNRLGQVFGNEVLNDLSLVVHDAVDTEVQVGEVKFKEFTQKLLKLALGIAHIHDLPFGKRFLPRRAAVGGGG